MNTKKNVLYIKEERSAFDPYSPMFAMLFNKVDRAAGKEKALELFGKSKYDVIIADLSVEPERAGFLKEMEDQRPGQAIFAMVSPSDSDKLFGIADMGINAFELLPEHFDQALEAIAAFNTPEEKNLIEENTDE